MSIDWSKLAVVDTETLGLDPDRHPIWEIAIITDGEEWVRQIRIDIDDLNSADPVALDICRFKERYDPERALPKMHAAAEIEQRLRGRHIVGAIPSFDEERIRRLCNQQLRDGYPPKGKYPWHYHLIDVEAMMVGYLSRLGGYVQLPWKSHELTSRIGVTVPSEDEHTALGDARWAKRVYERIVNNG